MDGVLQLAEDRRAWRSVVPNINEDTYTKVSHKAQSFHHNYSTCMCQRTQKRLNWSHLTLMTSLLQPPVLESKLQLSTVPDMQSVVTNWAERRSLQVSDQNSTVTLFTSRTQQPHHHLIVPVNGSPLPLDRCPTILGVTFDPHLFFHHHVGNIVEIAKLSLNLLRLLCDTNWSQYKETILATVKSLIVSLFTISAQIWFPNMSVVIDSEQVFSRKRNRNRK